MVLLLVSLQIHPTRSPNKNIRQTQLRDPSRVYGCQVHDMAEPRQSCSGSTSRKPKKGGVCPKKKASSNGVLGNDVWFLFEMMSCFRDSSFEFHVHLRKDKHRTPEDRASFVARSLPCIRYLLKHVSAELVSMYVPPHPASGKDPCTQDLKMPSRQSPQLAEPDNSLRQEANCAGQQCCIQ